MLYSADKITDVKLVSSDGAYGDIKDVCFDDAEWILRYFVVDVGGWLSGRRVLISPQSVLGYSEELKAFQTNLSSQQIKESPASDTESTVSRQQEELLSQHYGWSPYWMSPMGAYPMVGMYVPPYVARGTDVYDSHTLPPTVENDIQARRDQQAETHLRSFQEVKSYGLRAMDGSIGELDDMLIDPNSWRMTHLIADARKWWPGGQVVIDRSLVQNISWSDRKIEVAMTRNEIKNAPPYDPDQGINEAYQISLARYYQGFRHRTQLPPQHGAQDQSESQPHV